MRGLIAIAAVAWPLLATAQERPAVRIPIRLGDSLRVITLNGTAMEGTLLRQSGDSLTLQVATPGATAERSFASAGVATVEAWRRHRSAIKGLGLGLLAGAAAGGVLAASSQSGCTGDMCGMAIIAVPIMALGGGAVGLVAGGLHTTASWEMMWRQVEVHP